MNWCLRPAESWGCAPSSWGGSKVAVWVQRGILALLQVLSWPQRIASIEVRMVDGQSGMFSSESHDCADGPSGVSVTIAVAL